VKRQFINLFLESILLCIPGLSSTPVSSQMSHGREGIQRDFQAAMAAEDDGDLDRAEALLQKLHRKYPGTFVVDESLGLLFAERGEMSRALPLLAAGVREQPSSDVAHANFGAALYRVRRNQSAITEFERAVQINPENASSQQSLGRLWMDEHKPAKAANAFLAAVRIKPEDQDLKLDCATVLLQADRAAEAQKVLSSLANIQDSARAQSLLGEVHEKEGRFQAAAVCFARAADLDPSEQNAWQVGYEYLRHWSFEAAATEFAAASNKFPKSVRLRLGLGAALYGASQYERAIPVFADLLQAEPNNAHDAELLGMACDSPLPVSISRCELLVAYAEAHPRDKEAATDAASWLMKYENGGRSTERARRLLERALSVDPQAPAALLQMGVMEQEREDWKASIAFLERAVRVKPDYAEAHYRLALAYWRTGRKQDGQTQMDLQKKFAHQQQDDLERRLRQIIVLTLDRGR
jgi:tetratricopeptide (TPR) repeat protein